MTDEASSNSWLAVTSSLDEGAADMLQEALEAEEVPVEVRRRTGDVYAEAGRVQFEVWVPGDEVERARRVLETVATQLALDLESSNEPPLSRERPLRMSYAVAVGLLLPFPVSSFYAGARALAYALLGTFGLAIVALCVWHERLALDALVAIKGIDLALAPLLVALSRPAEQPRRGVGVGVALLMLVLGVVGTAIGFDLRDQHWQQEGKRAAHLFEDASTRLLAGERADAPQFPDVPAGRVYAAFYAYLQAQSIEQAKEAIAERAPIDKDPTEFELRVRLENLRVLREAPQVEKANWATFTERTWSDTQLDDAAKRLCRELQQQRLGSGAMRSGDSASVALLRREWYDVTIELTELQLAHYTKPSGEEIQKENALVERANALVQQMTQSMSNEQQQQ